MLTPARLPYLEDPLRVAHGVPAQLHPPVPRPRVHRERRSQGREPRVHLRAHGARVRPGPGVSGPERGMLLREEFEYRNRVPYPDAPLDVDGHLPRGGIFPYLLGRALAV